MTTTKGARNATPKDQEGQEAKPQATEQTTTDAAHAAAVVATATHTPPALDHHHGQGGLYTVVNGKRELVNRSINKEGA